MGEFWGLTISICSKEACFNQTHNTIMKQGSFLLLALLVFFLYSGKFNFLFQYLHFGKFGGIQLSNNMKRNVVAGAAITILKAGNLEYDIEITWGIPWCLWGVGQCRLTEMVIIWSGDAVKVINESIGHKVIFTQL